MLSIAGKETNTFAIYIQVFVWSSGFETETQRK